MSTNQTLNLTLFFWVPQSQRLVNNAEEIAFNDPPGGCAERLILNQHLRRLVDYSGLSALQRFMQQMADGYFVKYLASCVALAVYGAPIYFRDPSARGSQGQLTEDYIRSMRLLQNTSRWARHTSPCLLLFFYVVLLFLVVVVAVVAF